MWAISADNSRQAVQQKLAPRQNANPIGTQILVSELQSQNSHNTANGSFRTAIALGSVDNRTVLDNSELIAKTFEDFKGDEVINVAQNLQRDTGEANTVSQKEISNSLRFQAFLRTRNCLNVATQTANHDKAGVIADVIQLRFWQTQKIHRKAVEDVRRDRPEIHGAGLSRS